MCGFASSVSGEVLLEGLVLMSRGVPSTALMGVRFRPMLFKQKRSSSFPETLHPVPFPVLPEFTTTWYGIYLSTPSLCENVSLMMGD